MGACTMRDATFQWSQAPPNEEGQEQGKEDEAVAPILTSPDAQPGERAATLEQVTLTVPPGQLTIVVGPTGSGKSSLLAGRKLVCRGAVVSMTRGALSDPHPFHP